MTTPSQPPIKTGFAVVDLLAQRDQAVTNAIALLLRKLEEQARSSLLAETQLPHDTIYAFGDVFTVDLETDSKFVLEQVHAALLNVRVRHYDFEIIGSGLRCTRLRKAKTQLQPIHNGRGFDLDTVFHSIVKANQAQIEHKVAAILEHVEQQSYEAVSSTGSSFDIRADGFTRPVVRLAYERLKRAQRDGWRVKLEAIVDTAHRFKFIAPKKN